MDNADNALKGVFLRLTSPQILTEVIAIVLAGLIALAGAHVARTWQKNQLANSAPGRQDVWQLRVLEGTVLLAPFLVALIVLLMIRAVLAMLGTPTTAVDVALQLTTALVLVRLGVYLLRVMLGPESWIRAWENRITFVLWLTIGFSLVGWLDKVETTLNRINIIPGKTFSLWALMKGLVIVTAFVVVTSLVARAFERRVMKLEQLAVSTRIGISKFTYFFLVGLGMGCEVESMAYMISRYFGLRAFGTAFGHAFGAFMLSGAAGVFLMGAGYDLFHSYTVPLSCLCAAMVLSLILLANLGPYRFGVETKPIQPIEPIEVPSGA